MPRQPSHRCKPCGRTFRSRHALTKHHREEHASLYVWKCDQPDCDTPWWGSRQALSVHRWRAHGINSTQPRAVRKRRQTVREAGEAIGLPWPPAHECMCGETFYTRGDLASHRHHHNHYLEGEDT